MFILKLKMSSIIYIDFIRSENPKKIETLLINHLKNVNNKFCSDISTIIENYDKVVVKTLLTTLENKEEVYCAIICCFDDNLLVKLGKEFCFPRSFPIIFNAGGIMNISGFYPKFTNDTREQKYEYNDLRGFEKICCTKKFSGFLSGLVSWKSDSGIYYWTIFCKNSTGLSSPYIADAKRLWDPYVGESLFEQMHFNYTGSIWVETISKNEQTHGDRVLNEDIVVVCMSANVLQTETKDFGYIPVNELYKCCNSLKLPCEEPIIINGSVSCEFFTSLIIDNRDMMTHEKFEEILEKSFQNSSELHKKIHGDTLEGLVLHCFKPNGNMVIKKFKFTHCTKILC
jgi:hypothetical protein